MRGGVLAAVAVVLVGLGCAPGGALARGVELASVTLPGQGLRMSSAAGVDYVLVEKAERRMSLWGNGRLVAVFDVRLGRNPVGPKVREGDGRTPEGLYWIDGRNPKSTFYRSLHISYPAPRDRARAAELGADPGNAIVIHGLPTGRDPSYTRTVHAATDWTEGCIAVTNEEIEQLWGLIPDGTPIEIIP